ncbi:MAG: hypothetical protein Q8P84_06025 [Deltaproteobacteria bacterium]|nr:hypothetical protein [Deltaproteobacteria bacterium]
MKKVLVVLLLVLGPLSMVPGPLFAKEWLMEKLGNNEFAVARSYLDDFGKLAPDERATLYYLFRAAVAGRDVYSNQRHRDAVAIRKLVESLLERKHVPADFRSKLEEYAKLLWINNSQYHARTGLKFTPPFSKEEFKKVFPDVNISKLEAAIFDAKAEPVLTNLTPTPKEGDIIQASANNIYDRGLNLSDINGLSSFWKSKLNVRFAKASGVRPQTYKMGGVYGAEISNIIHFLKKALPLTKGGQHQAIADLIRYYETGEEEIFRKASVHWLQSEPKVDTINGFIESYMDPRQVVGSWEGIAYYTAQDPVLKGFSENVQYFEDHMPWKEAYKKKNISAKPVATLINVAGAFGEGGPVTWSGINLPNYQDIRSKYGSKNVVLQNMIESRSQVTKNMAIREFYLPEYRGLMKKYFEKGRRMLLYMHEVIGHGSGGSDPKLRGDPRDSIGKNYGAWEEARASLVAWWHIDDPKLVAIGAFKKSEQQNVMKAMYLLELQGQMLQLRNAKHEDVLREAHDRADQMIFQYLLENTKGFEVVEKDGNFYVQILDLQALRKGAGDLLKIVHEAKAKGDKKTVDGFLEKYGNHFNTKWRDNIVKRAKEIGLPELVAMTFPKMEPVVKNGEVVDVKIDNKESFREQQLRFGRISKTTEPE